MRTSILMLALILAFGLKACETVKPDAAKVNSAKFDSTSSTATAPVSLKTASKPDFDKQIKPILQSRCQPCHFQGGKVYDHLPFDRPETITRLGTKLFTRIKDEKEQRLIREFLAAQ